MAINGEKNGRLCRAVYLVRSWTDRHSIASLARRLDCSWERANSIVTGKSVPTVVEAFIMRDVCKAPVLSWEGWERAS